MIAMKSNELSNELVELLPKIWLCDLYRKGELKVHIYHDCEKDIYYKVCFKGDGYLEEVLSIQEINV